MRAVIANNFRMDACNEARAGGHSEECGRLARGGEASRLGVRTVLVAPFDT
jgi:hypothetical protein